MLKRQRRGEDNVDLERGGPSPSLMDILQMPKKILQMQMDYLLKILLMTHMKTTKVVTVKEIVVLSASIEGHDALLHSVLLM